MSQVSLNRRITMGLLPKPVLPGHHAPPPSEERPTKCQNRTKYREKPCLKQLKKAKTTGTASNHKGLTKYIINGKAAWKPYYKFGYNEKGKNTDPNSSLSKRKGKDKGGDGPTDKGKGPGKTGDAAPNTVQGIPPITHL